MLETSQDVILGIWAEGPGGYWGGRVPFSDDPADAFLDAVDQWFETTQLYAGPPTGNDPEDWGVLYVLWWCPSDVRTAITGEMTERPTIGEVLNWATILGPALAREHWQRPPPDSVVEHLGLLAWGASVGVTSVEPQAEPGPNLGFTGFLVEDLPAGPRNLANAATDLTETMAEAASDAAEAVKDAVSDLEEEVKSRVGSFVSGVKKTALKGAAVLLAILGLRFMLKEARE